MNKRTAAFVTITKAMSIMAEEINIMVATYKEIL